MTNEATSNVVFWNIWGHRVPLALQMSLMQFAKKADILCLTEVTHMATPYDPVPAVHMSKDPKEPPSFINGLEQLIETFNREYHVRYHTPKLEHWRCMMTDELYEHIGFGSALLCKRTLTLIDQGEVVLELGERRKARVLQWIVYEKANNRYLVAHLHGIWLPENTKGDAPERDLQSQLVRTNLIRISTHYNVHRIVFGGDLNLDLNTNALALLEQNGNEALRLQNHVRERGYRDTRTPWYRKYDEPGSTRNADYVLSAGVEVHNFIVHTKNTASDHAPLEFEFA